VGTVGLYGVLRSDREKIGARVALCVLVLMIGLVLAPSAEATVSSFKWTGAAVGGTRGWSDSTNWEAGSIPSSSGPVALEFPMLTSASCTSSPPTDTCYESENDESGLIVESMQVEDSQEYVIAGRPITLDGGLSAAPASNNTKAIGSIVALPIVLGAPQTWNIAGQSSDEAIDYNQLLLLEEVSGTGQPLTVDVSDGGGLDLANNTEVGSLSIEGSDPSRSGILNGLVDLLGAELNAADDEPVSLNHISAAGNGAIGPLKTDAAELLVEPGEQHAEPLEVESATLDPDSLVGFDVADTDTTPGLDYAQLASKGTIELDGAELGVVAEDSCTALPSGHSYTLITTTGGIAGSFGNAGEDQEIPVEFPKTCTVNPQHLRIEYHRSGGTNTVTATVIGTLPVNTNKPYVREEDSSEWGAIAGALSIAEYWNTKRAQEEAERKARAALESKQSTTAEASLASIDIAVQSNGMALVKLKCSGSASCVGKLTLTAVATSKGKHKRSHTTAIGTAGFSIAADTTVSVRLKLNATGRALLGADHGHLGARLTIAQSAPAPAHTQTKSVDLLKQKARGSRDGSEKK
jgi:hypothetical protein